jgi:hypothetical protein
VLDFAEHHFWSAGAAADGEYLLDFLDFADFVSGVV